MNSENYTMTICNIKIKIFIPWSCEPRSQTSLKFCTRVPGFNQYYFPYLLFWLDLKFGIKSTSDQDRFQIWARKSFCSIVDNHNYLKSLRFKMKSLFRCAVSKFILIQNIFTWNFNRVSSTWQNISKNVLNKLIFNMYPSSALSDSSYQYKKWM